jgi:YidC/Oxa1 family membrane protein insertase
MPSQNNSVARFVVPLVMALAGLGVVAAFFINSKPQAPGTSPATTPAVTPGAPADADAPGPSADGSGVSDTGSTPDPQNPEALPTGGPQTQAEPSTTAPEAGTPAATPVAHAGALRALPSGELHTDWPGIGAGFAVDDDGQRVPGLLDEASPFELRVEFSPYGAGIGSLLLAHHHTTWRAEQSQALQVTREWTAQMVAANGAITTAARAASPMAATRVWITENGVTRDAMLWQGPGRENVWRLVESGESFAVFAATVEEAAWVGWGGTGDEQGGTPLVRIVRRYEVTPNSYIVGISTEIENLSGRPLEVQVQSFGPTDPVPASQGSLTAGYGGDMRRVRFGYLAGPQRDPTQQFVIDDHRLTRRATVVSAVRAAALRAQAPAELWPTVDSAAAQQSLVWAGMTNRYFGVAVHTLVDDTAAQAGGGVAKALPGIARIDPLFEVMSPAKDDDLLAMRLTGAPVRVEPGATASTQIGLFAGPLSRPVINADARARAVNLAGLVVYNFGGFCGGCTFDWLTGPLIGLLRFLHDWITQDWALAIILLVVCVRGALHPVQKWSQIRTQRFAKQMQAMSPKLKKVQEKYKDDKAALQRETAKLWREEGITPASLVGCIPPFLQTPIWIALSAMIYFAVELRHEAGFYGVFQAMAPGWSFLADLSEPDAFLSFGRGITVPVVSWVVGPIAGLNLLPFILALVFYVHSKSIQPPPTATMTPEQQQAQMITKWMMVVLFPVMMYAAPAGFTLYFIANSTIAIFQTAYIKNYITRHDLDNPEKARTLAAARRKAVSNSDSFMARMAKRVEEAQRARQQPGPGKAMQRRTDPGKEPPRRFKDR